MRQWTGMAFSIKALPCCWWHSTQVWRYQHDCAWPRFGIERGVGWMNISPKNVDRLSVEWPPRSPGLTLPDFWLWSYIKLRQQWSRHRWWNLSQMLRKFIGLMYIVHVFGLHAYDGHFEQLLYKEFRYSYSVRVCYIYWYVLRKKFVER